MWNIEAEPLPPPLGLVTRGSNASMNKLKKPGEKEKMAFFLPSFPIPPFSQLIRSEAQPATAQLNGTKPD